jgi:small subunit ribosomal protein S17
MSPGWRMSKNKRHVVKRIIAPAQVPIDERPPIPTEEERWEDALAKRAAKEERRSLIKAAQEAKKLEETTSRRALRKLEKKKAKAEAAEQAEVVQQAEAEMRGEVSP